MLESFQNNYKIVVEDAQQSRLQLLEIVLSALDCINDVSTQQCSISTNPAQSSWSLSKAFVVLTKAMCQFWWLSCYDFITSRLRMKPPVHHTCMLYSFVTLYCFRAEAVKWCSLTDAQTTLPYDTDPKSSLTNKSRNRTHWPKRKLDSGKGYVSQSSTYQETSWKDT